MLLFLPSLYFYPISVFAETNTPPVTYEMLEFDAIKGPDSLIKVIIDWAFKFAGVFAFAMIVFAGFEYTVSGGNTNKQKDAQEKITSTIVGIILLFSFWIILNTINPDILKESKFAPAPAPAPAPTPTPATTPITAPDTISPTTDQLIDITSYKFPPLLTKELENYKKENGGDGVFLNGKLADALSDITKKELYLPFEVTDACVTNTLPCRTTPATANSRPPDACHYYGTCVDIDSKTGDNEMLIKIFNKQGLDVLDEGGWLHIALPEASGWGSYQNSCPNEENCCVNVGCWFGAT
jgi:hypothetical protein